MTDFDDLVIGSGMAGLAVLPVLALVAAAPALGAAEAAVDLFRERMTERVLAYTLGDHQRDQPAAQVRLATAMSELASAQARWDAALAELMSAPAAGERRRPEVGCRGRRTRMLR